MHEFLSVLKTPFKPDFGVKMLKARMDVNMPVLHRLIHFAHPVIFGYKIQFYAINYEPETFRIWKVFRDVGLLATQIYRISEIIQPQQKYSNKIALQPGDLFVRIRK